MSVLTCAETDLNDGGKVFSIEVVFCFQVKVTQLTGSYWIVLSIELIETLEGLSALQRQNGDRKEIMVWEVGCVDFGDDILLRVVIIQKILHITVLHITVL